MAQKSSQGLLHLCVPQGVDERVEHGSDYGVEDSRGADACPAGARRLQVDADGRQVIQEHHCEVGGACREGALPARRCADAQHRRGDEDVGDDDEDQAACSHNANVGKHDKLIDGGVCTGQLQHWRDVTEEVGDVTRPTVEQAEGEAGVEGGVHSTYGPSHPSQPGTHPPVHGQRVVQGAADSQVAVVGHGCVQEALGAGQEVEAEKLDSATLQGDRLSIQSQEACHDLGHCHRRQTRVQEGEVPQEVVHGGAEVRVRAHGDENEQIPRHGDAIDEEEEQKEQARVFSCVHQTLQEEVVHHRLVGGFCLPDHLLRQQTTDISRQNQ